MPRVKFIGPQGVPLAGVFIFPGDVREVSELQLAMAQAAHPGWFEVVDALTTAPLQQGEGERPTEQLPQGDEVSDGDSAERVEQPTAGRRGGAKRRA